MNGIVLVPVSVLLAALLSTSANADTYTAGIKTVGKLPGEVDLKSPIVKSESFENIAAQGLDNACYLDAEHYAAEFLYQNPDVCFWTVDEESGTVSEVAVPEVPVDAIALPSPTGKDDTAMLKAIINSSSGKTYVGSGTYKVNNLKIETPVMLYNMPMVPYNNAMVVVSVRSPDVSIFNSPIDGAESSNTNAGFAVMDGADRFVLVNSGVSNLRGSTNRNSAGVFLRGVDDFHLACNTFENIVNRSTKRTTSRANAIWMNGSANRSSTSGGVIANNYAENLQSSGKLEDAEFFTVQQFVEKDDDQPIRIYANRAVNAGKRMTKHQNSGALVYSNSYDWQDKNGELGDRRMFAMVNVQRASDVSARNNRFMAGAKSTFDYIFHANAKVKGVVQDNLHFDCNAIEIREKLGSQSGSTPKIISARAIQNSSSGRYEATNSSARNNQIFGNGDVKNYYSFGAGYSRFGDGRFDTSGNQFGIPYTASQHR